MYLKKIGIQTRKTKPTVLAPKQLMLHVEYSLVQRISTVKTVEIFVDLS